MNTDLRWFFCTWMVWFYASRDWCIHWLIFILQFKMVRRRCM